VTHFGTFDDANAVEVSCPIFTPMTSPDNHDFHCDRFFLPARNGTVVGDWGSLAKSPLSHSIISEGPV